MNRYYKLTKRSNFNWRRWRQLMNRRFKNLIKIIKINWTSSKKNMKKS